MRGEGAGGREVTYTEEAALFGAGVLAVVAGEAAAGVAAAPDLPFPAPHALLASVSIALLQIPLSTTLFRASPCTFVLEETHRTKTSTNERHIESRSKRGKPTATAIRFLGGFDSFSFSRSVMMGVRPACAGEGSWEGRYRRSP